MSAVRVRWLAGAPELTRAVEAALADPAAAECLRDNPRRRILRVPGPGGGLLVKHYRLRTGRHPRRELAKAALRLAAPDREWRALRRLHRAGVPVPEPLARGVVEGGDRITVLRFHPEPLLSEALGDLPARERRAALGAVGDAVARLHGAGWIHGDLHAGNLLASAGGAVLLDLQRARRSRFPRARRRDLAFLHHSLLPLTRAAERVALGRRILARRRLPPAAIRAELRRIGRAARARAAEHAASRTRRALRPGRRFAELRLGPFRGLRLREVEPAWIAAVVEAHRRAAGPALLKEDGRSRVTRVVAGARSTVVKQVRARGAFRLLADRLRGAPAWRAFRGGHGLEARGIRAARPLACLVRWRAGLPVESLVLLEDLGGAVPADRAVESGADPESVLLALADLAARLHLRGVDHGDLKASHVLLPAPGPPGEPALIDLEGVRFRRRVPERRRRLALAQLNASLPDAFPSRARHAAFCRYVARIPFRQPAAEVEARVVAASLARRHRWSGADCQLAAGAASGPAARAAGGGSGEPARPAGESPRR